MAAITFNRQKNLLINPSNYYVPVRSAIGFVDSDIFEDVDDIFFYGISSSVKYYNYNKSSDITTIGSNAAYSSYIYLNGLSSYILIDTDPGGGGSNGTLSINASTSPTATGIAAYLPININGTNYKIALRNV